MSDEQPNFSTHLDGPAPAPLAGKVILAILAIPLWLVVGGFLSIGPYLIHGIEKTVGVLAIPGAALAWLALLVTGLLALFKPGSNTLRALGINLLVWVGLLAYIYFR